MALPPLRRTAGWCVAFSSGTCTSSTKPCSSGGTLRTLPFGKLLLISLSSGMAMIWISPHLSQFSNDLVDRLPTSTSFPSTTTSGLVRIRGSGSRLFDSRILFSMFWLFFCSSELEAMLERMRRGRNPLRDSSDSIIWLPKAVLIVSLEPWSGTCKLWRFTLRWRKGSGLAFWIVDVLSTSILVPGGRKVDVWTRFCDR
jgi:hypothetical protein